MKILLVDECACTGCRACQVACVAEHDGVFGVAAARVRVTKVEPLGTDTPHVCRCCRPAPCVEACPVAALRLDERTGAVLVAAEACTGCGACADACPYGMAILHPATGVALICDLCEGDPACVRRCATGAIRYATPGEGERSRDQRRAVEGREAGRDA